MNTVFSLRYRLAQGMVFMIGLAAVAAVPIPLQAQPTSAGPQIQIEEVIVSAQRRETNLQETPMSIQAFSDNDLEQMGIESGAELGIMVPNIVLNPGTGQDDPSYYIRGLPGVGIYIDGVWQGPFGFLETNFVEMERVEVLRGPQGTLFGRNTNGGAINMITKKPAAEFGVRINGEAGEFDRRNLMLAVDVPIVDSLKTKWMAASLKNDGFLKSLSVNRSLGDQDDRLLRGDILWEPLDNLSLRLTINDEEKAGTDARIVRFTNTDHPRFKAQNILAGNPEFLSAVRAIDPAFPDPPKQLISDRFGPLTHEPDYPGGAVGKWETKSDNMADGIKRDLSYYTLTANLEIIENLQLETIFSKWELDRRQVIDFDGSEFTITTDDIRNLDNNETIELHLTGSHFDSRVNWLLGYYSLEQESKQRFYRWGLWDFAIPNTGPDDPALDIAAMNYVRSYGAVIGDPELENYFPIVLITADELTEEQNEDSAWFGEVTVSITEQLDATVGVRVSEEDGRSLVYTPTGAFRTDDPRVAPRGNVYGGVLTTVAEDEDLGSITTNKFALTYQLNDDIMFYGSWAEGFTSGGLQNVNNVGIVELDPEIITTREVGIKSDWFEGLLRVNAAYFDSEWDGMRVQQLPPDPDNPGASLPFPFPTSDGLGDASGLEVDIAYIPVENLLLTLGLGLIDTSYSERGAFDGVNGISPNSPFAYAPEKSASLGVQYDINLGTGGDVLLAANYGWMDEYVRDAAYQRIPIDDNGDIIYEPAYGVLNARITYESPNRQWHVSLWGNNLGDEQYVNGGFDTRNVWGYDFTVVGRSREVGVSFGVEF